MREGEKGMVGEGYRGERCKMRGREGERREDLYYCKIINPPPYFYT